MVDADTINEEEKMQIEESFRHEKEVSTSNLRVISKSLKLNLVHFKK